MDAHRHNTDAYIHGSHPAQVLPRMFWSVAWSIRAATCSSSVRPVARSFARMFSCLSPRATLSKAFRAAFLECPSRSSSLLYRKGRTTKWLMTGMKRKRFNHSNRQKETSKCAKKLVQRELQMASELAIRHLYYLNKFIFIFMMWHFSFC